MKPFLGCTWNSAHWLQPVVLPIDVILSTILIGRSTPLPINRLTSAADGAYLALQTKLLLCSQVTCSSQVIISWLTSSGCVM